MCLSHSFTMGLHWVNEWIASPTHLEKSGSATESVIYRRRMYETEMIDIMGCYVCGKYYMFVSAATMVILFYTEWADNPGCSQGPPTH